MCPDLDTLELEEVKRVQRYEAPRLSVLGSFQGSTLQLTNKCGFEEDVLTPILQLVGSITLIPPECEQ